MQLHTDSAHLTTPIDTVPLLAAPTDTAYVATAVPAPGQQNTMPTIPQLAIALGGLVLIFGVSYLPFRSSDVVRNAPIIPVQSAVVTTDETDYFSDVSITAHSAYVWDIRNQRVLYSKNAGAQLPLASLTKLMTALVASENLSGQETVIITDEAIRQEGDSHFTSGEHFSFTNLIGLTLMTSSNDGAYALAAAAGASLGTSNTSGVSFIDAMNARGEELGLSQSYFTNPTGLDVDEQVSGSYGSARDMASLMEYIATKHPDILAETREQASTIYDEAGVPFNASNTNEVAGRIPSLIGSKTGFTDLAGGNLVIAFDAGLNRPIVISVLGSTREGRFDDMMMLVKRAQNTTMHK